jgi:hypothetical protein
MPKKRYPDNWWEWSYFMRAESGFRCERCGDPENPEGGHTLTTNLLIRELGVITPANLVVLCRHCQGHVLHMPLAHLASQLEIFDPFELRWLRPHLDGLGIQVPDLSERRN